jgi:hypothetical protein
MFSLPEGVERAKSLVTSNAINAAGVNLATNPYFAAEYASAFSSWAVAWEAQIASGIDSDAEPPHSFRRPEQRHQAGLIRDLFGNPFRPAPTIERATLAWNDGTVVRLATAIYEERAFDRMPVLADALQEAGCEEGEILGHCRQPDTVHVRGCHVLDWLLGKR